MPIKYDPVTLLKKIAPESKIKKLMTSRVTLKKTALSFVNDIDFLSKKSIVDTALKVMKNYKARIKADPDIKSDLLDDPAQLIQRVQNEVITQVADSIRENYAGEKYEWLPSSSDEPDPEHQLNYGQVFTIGVGEQPGDRFGCKCGMNILTSDSSLEL